MRFFFLYWFLLTNSLLFGCVIEAPTIENDPEPGFSCEDQACPDGFVCEEQAPESDDMELSQRFVCVPALEPTECNPRDHRTCDHGSVCLIDQDAPCEPSASAPDGSFCTDDCRSVFRCQTIDPPEYEGCDSSDVNACELGYSCRFDAQVTHSACIPYVDCADEGHACLMPLCPSVFTCQPDALVEGNICSPEGGTICEDGMDCLIDEDEADCPNIVSCGPDEDCIQTEVICAPIFKCQRPQPLEPVICHPSEPYACAPGLACQFDEALSDCEQFRCGDDERCGPAVCEDVFTCQPRSEPPVAPQPEPHPQPEPENETCDQVRCAQGYVCELRGVDGCFGEDLCLPRGPSVLEAVCVGQVGTRCNPDERIDRCAGGLGCMDIVVESSDFECDAQDDCGQATTSEYQCLRY